MGIAALPQSIDVAGVPYDIRTDYRDILRIMQAYDDPELRDAEKVYVTLYVLYRDFDEMPEECYTEAYAKAVKFLEAGVSKPDDKKRRNPKIVDWEQDAPMLFAALNKVAGREIRAAGEYMHWWTFWGLFMSIEEGLYSRVLQIRSKKANHKKLEKYEQEFWDENRDICQLRERLTSEEREAKAALEALLDGTE